MNNRQSSFGTGQEEEHLKVLSENEMNAQQLSDAFSQNSQMEEYCPQHQDLYVAFNKKTQTLFCNKCIFNEIDDYEQADQYLTFTSQMASSLKDLFDDKFALYKATLQRMDTVKPEKISSNLESTVNQFFNHVMTQIDSAQASVLNKLEQSRNLKELESILSQSKSGFGIELDNKFEQGKQEIETNVQKGLFSVVVQSKDNYDSLIKQMEGASVNMQTAMDEGQKRIEKILVIKQDKIDGLGKRLNEIVNNCLEIDIRGDQVKRQKISEEEQKANNFQQQKQALIEQQRRQQEERQREIERRAQEEQEKQRREVEAQRLEQQRLEQEKLEQQRQELIRLEQQRLEQQKQEQLRREQEEQERLKKLELERLEQERVAKEQQEAEEKKKQEEIERQRLFAEEQQRLQKEEEERKQQQALAEEQARQEQEKQRLILELQQKAEEEARQKQEEMMQQMLLQQQQAVFEQQQYNLGEQQIIPDNLNMIEQEQQIQMIHQEPVQAAEQIQMIIQDQEDDQHSHHQIFEENQQQQFIQEQFIQSNFNQPIQIIDDIQEQQIFQQQQVIQINDAEVAQQEMLQMQQQQVELQQQQEIMELQQQQNQFLIRIADGQYSKFYKQKQSKVWRLQLNLANPIIEFDVDDILNFSNSPIFLSKIVNLPNDRIFLIGGAEDLSCKKSYNNVYEIERNQETDKFECKARCSMTMTRAAFGCAVYPNYSQIFVCGGSVNEYEATKQCERYIVEQNAWKRLPDLNEAKFSQGLCFFNNGSTLYSFGGLLKTAQNQYQPTDKIESLSKGQNTWRLLNVRLPYPMFDMGSFELNESEIILFGGFNEGPLDKVLNFRINAFEGDIQQCNQTKLAEKDFFVLNGVSVKIPAEFNQGNREIIVTGHNHLHAFDLDRRSFRQINQKQLNQQQ